MLKNAVTLMPLASADIEFAGIVQVATVSSVVPDVVAVAALAQITPVNLPVPVPVPKDTVDAAFSDEIVGELPNTSAPLPVSSVIALARFALDGVAKNVATPVPSPETPVEIGKPVALVSVPPDGVPNAPPLTTNAPALPTLTARAVATPVPRPEMPVETGRPVAFVNVPDDGVPSAPPLTTNAPAEPVFTANAVSTPEPGTVTPNVPSPPEVVTKPLLVKLDSVAMFWLVLTVIVFVERVRPVENVSGLS